MADNKKEVQTPFNLGDKITMYAPLKALNKNVILQHEPGEEVKIHPAQQKKFASLGYTETAPEKPAATFAATSAANKPAGDGPGVMTTGGTK